MRADLGTPSVGAGIRSRHPCGCEFRTSWVWGLGFIGFKG